MAVLDDVFFKKAVQQKKLILYFILIYLFLHKISIYIAFFHSKTYLHTIGLVKGYWKF